MRFLSRGSFISIFAAVLHCPRSLLRRPLSSNCRIIQKGMLTGKERLGPKWMDEQRIDNCKVPIDKRGTKPRTSIRPHVPVG